MTIKYDSAMDNAVKILNKRNFNNIKHKIEWLIYYHIEKQFNVKILFCVEMGSRVYGVERSDSDYDVRFVYIHKDKSKYSLLTVPAQTIELSYECADMTIDIQGWDAKKFLKMMQKSNVSVYEWLNSSIVYGQCFREMNLLDSTFQLYVREHAIYYHYRGFAHKELKRYRKTGALKNLFLALRATLQMGAIESGKNLYFDIYSMILVYKPPLKNSIENLVNSLKNKKSLSIYDEEVILDFVENNKDNEFAFDELTRNKDFSALNELFIKLLDYYV